MAEPNQRRQFLKNAGALSLSACVAAALGTSCESYTALEESSTGVTISIDLKDRQQISQAEYNLLQK